MRNVPNRYRGLPPRTPEMLFNIVRKFYRGAVSHYELIQDKKAEVRRAWENYRTTGESERVEQALTTLFLEFHFYVTCWLQIDLALYRLMRLEGTKQLTEVMEPYRDVLEKHLSVREQLDRTEACVQAQWEHFGQQLACVEMDAYWFEGIVFTVDEDSLAALHGLYEAIMKHRSMTAS
ncbi:hypothetical protein [Brevibacillus sp. H7]|uniref:hypothetical protein n=1 Tax=Brevibacillus sp. H7 TaxID=3349138 RepID=UPI003822A103